jgi:hypothetical protein
VFEQFCYVGSLFARVCECGPGLFCGYVLWVWGVLPVGFFGGRIGKELLCRMLWVVFSSCRYSADCS